MWFRFPNSIEFHRDWIRPSNTRGMDGRGRGGESFVAVRRMSNGLGRGSAYHSTPRIFSLSNFTLSQSPLSTYLYYLPSSFQFEFAYPYDSVCKCAVIVWRSWICELKTIASSYAYLLWDFWLVFLFWISLLLAFVECICVAVILMFDLWKVYSFTQLCWKCVLCGKHHNICIVYFTMCNLDVLYS